MLKGKYDHYYASRGLNYNHKSSSPDPHSPSPGHDFIIGGMLPNFNKETTINIVKPKPAQSLAPQFEDQEPSLTLEERGIGGPLKQAGNSIIQASNNTLLNEHIG